jgi:hypothetical protein
MHTWLQRGKSIDGISTGDVLVEDQQNDGSESAAPTFAELMRATTDSQWGAMDDHSLVRYANARSAEVDALPCRALRSKDFVAYADDDSTSASTALEAFARFCIIRVLNENATVALPLIDFSAHMSRATNCFLEARGLLLHETKQAFWRSMLTATVVHTQPHQDEYERPQSIPSIEVDRICASDAVLRKMPLDARFHVSVLGQVQKALQKFNTNQLLRRSFTHVSDAGQERAFFLRFRGEGVLDNGGPYRALFQLTCWDEPSGALNIFTPPPASDPHSARTSASGTATYTLNPNLRMTEETRETLRTIGRLLGLAHRNNIVVPMELSASVWKSFANHFVGQRNYNPTLLSLRTAAIVRGLAESLPVEILAMFNSVELEELLSGRRNIDLGLLREMTVYDGNDITAESSHVSFLWESLESFSNEQRILFVDFVSGGRRLPRTPREFKMCFKISTLSVGSDVNPDTYLPRSQTCFFTLSLPHYSTFENCRSKLLYAIEQATTMDADVRENEAASFNAL